MAVSIEEILEFILADGHPEFDPAIGDLLEPDAATLAAIASKISSKDLADLLSFGVAIRQSRFGEFTSGVQIETVMRGLGKRWDGEGTAE